MSTNELHRVYTSCEHGSFGRQLDDLCHTLGAEAPVCDHGQESYSLVYTKIFLSDALNQTDELKKHSLYTDILGQAAVSIVEQPPLDGSKINLLCIFARNAVCRHVDGESTEIACGHTRLLFQSGRLTDEQAGNADVPAQTRILFDKHTDLLHSYGLNLAEHCQRTWIYVRDIDTNYAGVVDARNRLFERHGLTSDTHYIASTGIGGLSESRKSAVSIDFLSVIEGLQPDGVFYLKAPEYLNPTHEYGVAFERGTRLTLGRHYYYLISGTASIDNHGHCLHRGDVLQQAERLFLNIDKLLQSGGADRTHIQSMIVYLRDVADYACISRYLQTHFPHTPAVITEARVCRPEWLIETECIACKAIAE